MKFFLNSFVLIVFLLVSNPCAAEPTLFWWHAGSKTNFGDDLSRVIVERMIGHPVKLGLLHRPGPPILLAAGSILHYARSGDVVWGSGFREDPMQENRFQTLDVRAVRGPLTREFLLRKGVDCPEVYGDPAVAMAHLFPELKRQEPVHEYIIIPNMADVVCFAPYKNVVIPTLPWDQVIGEILKSKLVISSSLHGVIVAESFGVPARLIKMTWMEKLLKYRDYYESTGRPDFQYATSVQEALQMGGEKPGYIDVQALLDAFPWDYFGN